jgi:hypothetical protein
MRHRCLRKLCALTAVGALSACATDNVPAGAPLKTAFAKAVTVVTGAPLSPGTRTEKWIDLQVGECVTDLPPADLSRVTVTVVDCGTAHLAEVYLRAPLAVDTAIATVANRNCTAGIAPYIGQPVDNSPFSVTYLIDSNQDRTGANPTPSTVICLLQAANGQLLTGSAHR